MTIELRDVLTLASILVALASVLIVNRNARRATSVQTENTDMTRIRDLRAELREAKDEVHHLKGQVDQLAQRMTEANDAATAAYRERAEMIRVARMPGMDMDRWLARFEGLPPQLNGTMES